MPRRRPARPEGPELPLETVAATPRVHDTYKPPSSGSATTTAFIEAASRAEREYRIIDDPWDSSPFAWVKKIPSASRAKAAESIIITLLSMAGFRASSPRPGELSIEDRLVRVKFSTLWASGTYTFQQISSTEGVYVILFGLSPHVGHIWVLPPSTLEQTTSDWLTVDPASPLEYLTGYGGTLDEFIDATSRVIGSPSSLPSGPFQQDSTT